METSASIDYLVTAATEKIDAFHIRLSYLNLVHFPTTNPKTLIELFSRISVALRRKLTHYREKFVVSRTEEIRHSLIREVKLLVLLTKTLGARLRYIEGASIERTPWSMVHAVQELAQGLLDESTALIIRPQWHYNYGGVDVIEEWRSDLDEEADIREVFDVAEWNAIVEGLPKNFYVLSFPGLERDNVLLHVSLGHEIGHLVVGDYLNQEEFLFGKHIRNEIEQLKPEQENEIDSKFETDADRIKRAFQIRRRALEEIAADCFAISIFGPAALLALHEFALFARSMDKVSAATDWYPPWRMRLRYALRHLDWPTWHACFESVARESKWTNGRVTTGSAIMRALNDHVSALEQIASKTDDEKEIQKDPLTQIAYGSLDESVERAKSYLETQVEESRRFLSTQERCAEIFALLERLHYKIPPNEFSTPATGSESQTAGRTRTPATLASIFNAGWFHRIAYLPSLFAFDESKTYFEELDVLNRLVLKAIEISDLQKAYEPYSLLATESPN